LCNTELREETHYQRKKKDLHHKRFIYWLKLWRPQKAWTWQNLSVSYYI